jgi:hypothetical protein
VPHVRSAILCDFAQIREGLLFVSSGGITRMVVPDIGAPLSFWVAGQVEVDAAESGTSHEVTFKAVSTVAVRTLWEAQVMITTSTDNDGLFPGESTLVPFALNVGPLVVSELGPHDLRVSISGAESELLTFYVLTATPEPH